MRIVGLVLLSSCGTGMGSGETDTVGGNEDDLVVGNLVAAACELGLRCGCVEAGESSECLSGKRDRLLRQGTVARNRGLSFDPGCYAAVTRVLRELDCSGLAGLEGAVQGGAADCSPCLPYHGTMLVGQSCQRQYLDASTCAQGLVCSDEVCVDPCLAEEHGEGEACESSSDCAGDLVCHPDLSVCVELPGAGQPCLGAQCDEGLRCDFDGPGMAPIPTCVPLTALDGECMGHFECESVYCPAGRCANKPKLGQRCGAQETCAEGLACDGEFCFQPGTNICQNWDDALDDVGP